MMGRVAADPGEAVTKTTSGVIVLLSKAQTSVISGTRRIRVLIASGNPERIMLVRESLHAWPETVVCRVAVNREDAINQFESHAPHVMCWPATAGCAFACGTYSAPGKSIRGRTDINSVIGSNVLRMAT